MRERRAVFVPDREALVAGYSPEAVGFLDRMGFTTTLCLPLGQPRPLGRAGHPPPLLRTPDGRVTLLEDDILLHRDLGPFHRTATPSQAWRTATNGATGTERLTSAGPTVLYTALAGTGARSERRTCGTAGMAPTHGRVVLSGVLPVAFSTHSLLRR
ncbi:hypothetical protein [Streptomyces virginiae]|uniref:hypothetical protein n=1 Tax=Streptomyces virginiae TaxID=1961 RepID=UPI0022549EC8|nr:hypothetical protein [Streptomyces virginiae]MCX5174487.1 hypothetical protein [Streptomyces virginiae]